MYVRSVVPRVITKDSTVKAGDVLIEQRDDGDWQATKILAVDVWPDDSEVFHCLFYKATSEKPTAASVKALEIAIYHAPVDAAGFHGTAEVLCASPVEDHELIGLVEYLKMTDFGRYLEFTGQDTGALVADAKQHYLAAIALDEAGDKEGAIEAYSRSIDRFPLFFEAIDNRGLTYWELGDHTAALADFEASLRVNPEGNTAFFSRGECLLQLGRLEDAEQAFEEGSERFAEHRDLYQKYLALTREQKAARNGRAAPVRADTPKQRPWWRFWS